MGKIQEKLIAIRLHRKDPDALGELYDLYAIPIYRFIYFKVSSVQDAEDLTSDVFIKIWAYATGLGKPIGQIRALLYQTARTIVIDFYRRRAKEGQVSDSEDLLAAMPDDRQQSLLEQIEAKVELSTIEPALRLLKDEYREAIVLHYVEGLDVAEISSILNKSKGAVRVIIHRGIRAIREQLENSRNV